MAAAAHFLSGGFGSSGIGHSAGRDVYLKLAVAVTATWVLILTAAFIFSEQADRYSNTHIVAVMRQLVYETPFQPLFLVVILVPIYLAAARGVAWPALISGGLIMVAVVLPFARFAALDVNAVVGADPVDGIHNSLFQLAGPGHEMPQFVSTVTLMLMAGVVTMFWQPRIGGIIGLMAVISLAFIWEAALDDPPSVGNALKIGFIDGDLQFGYYLAWAGAIAAVLGEWAWRPWWSRAARTTGKAGATESSS
ncbi:MAG: hypothetical protein IIB28_09285 [Chloroflexi bacterium]|nr:hypothetical protein [Chloroflexota bacterium]